MKKLKMKKELMLLIALVTISVATYAQKGLNIEIHAQPGMTMGGDFQVPTDNSNSNSYVSPGKSFTLGMNTGASVGYNFNDKVGVSLGLLFSHQGQNYKSFTYTVSDNFTEYRSVSLNYLKIPILFNFVSAPEKSVSFTCSAGFYLGFLTGYKDETWYTYSDGSRDDNLANGSTLVETYTPNTGTSSTDNAAFLSKPYKSADFGGILAVGLQFKLSDKIVMPLMLNYQIGFSDVKNESSEYTQSNSSDANLYWQSFGGGSGNPNSTLSYHNSSLGIKIGLKILL
jgi:hypothetical protein